MAAVQSSRNPFRNLVPSTALTVSASNARSTCPAEYSEDGPETLPGAPPSTSSSEPPIETLTEELPPAYTPAADTGQGEQTVEYGPTRPFQNPPLPPRPQPPLSQPQSLWRQITGALDQLALGPPPLHYTGHTPSPQSQSGRWTPQIQPQQGYASPPPLQPSSPQSPRPTSDFARDFYAAGTGADSEIHSQNSGNASRYAPPPGPPPSGPPPSGPPGSPQANDDGRPTKTPVPGHPFLHDGCLLVYPAGFECDKCHNTGYKHHDPTHPCRKCWSKYSKPFTGAITYGSFSNASAGNGKTFQRPLPRLRPPQGGARQQNGGYPGAAYRPPPPPPPPPRPLGLPAPAPPPPPPPHQQGQGQGPYYAPPPPPPHIQTVPVPNPFGGPYGYGSRAGAAGGPPPGSVVYPPGDPRIGGRLCWRCGGDGLVGGFLWEEECPVCRGIGRVFG